MRELHDVPADAREGVHDHLAGAAARLVPRDGLRGDGEPPLAVQDAARVELREEAEALPPGSEARQERGKEEARSLGGARGTEQAG